MSTPERPLCCALAIATQDGPVKEGKELSCGCGNRYKFVDGQWRMINPFQKRPPLNTPKPPQEPPRISYGYENMDDDLNAPQDRICIGGVDGSPSCGHSENYFVRTLGRCGYFPQRDGYAGNFCAHRCTFAQEPTPQPVNVRSHESYCGLTADHEGTCQAVITRLITSASNQPVTASPAEYIVSTDPAMERGIGLSLPESPAHCEKCGGCDGEHYAPCSPAQPAPPEARESNYFKHERMLTAEELIDIERFQKRRRKQPVPQDAWLYVAEIDRLLTHIRLDREQLENEIFQDATDPAFGVRSDSEAPLTVENLAELVLTEARGCDDCDEPAVWSRYDDPETSWFACDKHKDKSQGWQERSDIRYALLVRAAAKGKQD